VQLRDAAPEVDRAADRSAVMTAERELPILDAEAVEAPPIDLDKLLDPQPLRYPPAVVETAVGPTYAELAENGCICGNATARGHGGLTCDQVLNIRARVVFGQLSRWKRLRARLRGYTPTGWPR
jgi:hypothetical protein